MKKLAIIGAQRMAKHYAINAREMGVETYCFAWDQGAVAKEFVDHFYPISIFDTDKILAELNNIGVDGIVSTSELTIAIVAELAEKLNLISLDPEVAKVVTDKYRNRCATKDVPGLKHPKFACVKDIDEARMSGVGFPCILKPLSEGGKRGVIVVRSESELPTALEYSARESKRKDVFLQEEFLSGGKEYSVETLSFRGKSYMIQVTEKITSGPPHCVELGHFQPADLPMETKARIEEVLGRALVAAGITNGPCHTEIKIINGEIYLIEFNARPGGDFISYPLTELSTGYPYLKGAIQIAMGDFVPPEKEKLKPDYAGVCFVTKQTPLLIPLFEKCQQYQWCWSKNSVGEMSELQHNNCDGVNHFIWKSSDGFPKELELIRAGAQI